MCDKELLLDYLYGELEPSARETFDRHLTSCAECRAEVDGLRGTRVHLASWAPPEPDLGFQIVRGAKVTPMPAPRTWRPSPVWPGGWRAVGVAASRPGSHRRRERHDGANQGGRDGRARCRVHGRADAEVQAIAARLTDLGRGAARPTAAVVPASTTAGGRSMRTWFVSSGG